MAQRVQTLGVFVGQVFNRTPLVIKGNQQDGRGIILHVLVANQSVASVTAKVSYVDPTDTSKVFDIPGAATAAIAANGETVLIVYPGVTAVANQSVSYPVPYNYQVTLTFAGASGSLDVTVSVESVP